MTSTKCDDTLFIIRTTPRTTRRVRPMPKTCRKNFGTCYAYPKVIGEEGEGRRPDLRVLIPVVMLIRGLHCCTSEQRRRPIDMSPRAFAVSPSFFLGLLDAARRSGNKDKYLAPSHLMFVFLFHHPPAFAIQPLGYNITLRLRRQNEVLYHRPPSRRYGRGSSRVRYSPPQQS